jgi:serine/threonine protein kinase
MNYPLILEYRKSIKSAKVNFNQLCNLEPVLDNQGNPVMYIGEISVVFKMRDKGTGKFYAVKCFLKDQPDRSENYRMIAEELDPVSSTFLTQFKYLNKELLVHSASIHDVNFPVLVMDWVKGEPLGQYIRRNIGNRYALEMLVYQFSRLAIWLLPQPFAHGDLNPDNIMVHKDGTLVLVDYDGMYVPAMQGRKARELGSPDFRHPARSETTFNEHIDDFSLVSILLSLKLIAKDATLLDKYGASDRLLFSKVDYRDLTKCQLLKNIFPSEDTEVNVLVSLFTIALMNRDLSHMSFRLLDLKRPEKREEEVTREDLVDAWKDEFGASYSRNRKRLLKGPFQRTQYSILPGTEVICDATFCLSWWSDPLSFMMIPDSETSFIDSAFRLCSSLKSIIIPNSVTSIGDWAFKDCSSLKSVVIPNSVTSIGDGAFKDCSSLKSVVIPDSVTSIGDGAFYGCKSLESVVIPNSVTSVGDWAFKDCSSLKSVVIPNSVTSVGDWAFKDCSSLKSVVIPNSVTSVGNWAFYGCKSLESVVIPNSVTSIGDVAFPSDIPIKIVGDNFYIYQDLLIDKKRATVLQYLKSDIKSAVIPDSVTSIDNWAFKDCTSLESVVIPNSVTSIGNSTFGDCKSLESVVIPNSVTSIGDGAFKDCSSLKSVVIPDSVTSIGDGAFKDCSSLKSVVIPDSVTSIGGGVFSGCKSLESITIPDLVRSIVDWAFPSDIPIKIVGDNFYIYQNLLIDRKRAMVLQYLKSDIKSVTIPDSVTNIGDRAFYGCKSLESIVIPDSVTSIGDGAFDQCHSLRSIIIPKGTRPKFEKLLPLSLYTILLYDDYDDHDDLGDDDYDEPTCEKYNGSYAQDVEGWSDQDIDDAFDGDPDAYWNID